MFQDEEVDKKVKYKLGIFDDREPSEEELNQVREIMISNLNLRGEVIHTNLSEIPKLKRLASLDLRGFELTEEILKDISTLKEITTLRFFSCYSKENITIHLGKLKSLVFDNCEIFNFSGVSMPESLLIINGGMIDLDYFTDTTHLQDLGIKNSDLINSSKLEEFKRLKELNLDGTTLDDMDILKRLEKKGVSVSNEFEYHPLR